MLPLLVTLVLSLVWELTSCMLCGQKKGKMILQKTIKLSLVLFDLCKNYRLKKKSRKGVLPVFFKR